MATADTTTNGSLQQNPTLHSMFHALDPISLLLSQNSDPLKPPVALKLTTDSYFMERGPRYSEYAQLREARLRRRRQEEEEDSEPKRSPLKKQVKFQENLNKSRKGGSSSVSSVLAQSVPDFSATLRKENRKPRAPTLDLTPPTSKQSSKASGNLSNSRGSKSANAGEKRGVMMARKSYASIEELRGMSMGVAKDICGGPRNGSRTGVAKPVLGYRHIGY